MRKVVGEFIGVRMKRYADGETLTANSGARKDADWYVHRNDLWQCLVKEAEAAGARIVYDKHVTSVGVDSGTVRCGDGTEYDADLIVGADGVHSQVRKAMFPDAKYDPVVSETAMSYQVPVPKKVVEGISELKALYEEGKTVMWFAPSRFVVGCATRLQECFDCHFNIAPMSGQPESPFNKEVIQSAGGRWNGKLPEEKMVGLRQSFSDHESALVQALEGCDTAYFWRLAEVGQLPAWSRGRAVLVGDAAHAILPWAGAGTSLCIEDAGSLGELLDAHVTIKELPERLKMYESLRRPRVELVREVSNRTGIRLTLENGEMQEQRDQGMRMYSKAATSISEPVEPDRNAGVNTPAFRAWLLGYDAVQEAREAISA